MKVVGGCGIGVSSGLAAAACGAACSAAAAVPDISGTYWATSYSPKIEVVDGGEPPLNAAGRAAYEMNQAGLRDGSIVDKARRVCVPDGVPRVLATPYPFEIFQAPAERVTFVYEMNHQVRVIIMDKRYAGGGIDRLLRKHLPRCERPASQRRNEHLRTHPQNRQPARRHHHDS
jgi:hypothetical protein